MRDLLLRAEYLFVAAILAGPAFLRAASRARSSNASRASPLLSRLALVRTVTSRQTFVRRCQADAGTAIYYWASATGSASVGWAASAGHRQRHRRNRRRAGASSENRSMYRLAAAIAACPIGRSSHQRMRFLPYASDQVRFLVWHHGTSKTHCTRRCSGSKTVWRRTKLQTRCHDWPRRGSQHDEPIDYEFISSSRDPALPLRPPARCGSGHQQNSSSSPDRGFAPLADFLRRERNGKNGEKGKTGSPAAN